jgi:hypothetical protein
VVLAVSSDFSLDECGSWHTAQSASFSALELVELSGFCMALEANIRDGPGSSGPRPSGSSWSEGDSRRVWFELRQRPLDEMLLLHSHRPGLSDPRLRA